MPSSARPGSRRWPPRGATREEASELRSSDPVVGVLLDLGVSSHQLDTSERGFSYRTEGPLDMRMGPDDGPTAAEFLRDVDEDALAALLVANGERRFGRGIAKSILSSSPTSTAELAAAVERAVPAAARRRGHVASRTFQALRIAVNEELDELATALAEAQRLLVEGGRLVVISYHSGEDALVKSTLRDAATGGCTCPPQLPCVCGAVPSMRLVTRGAHKARGRGDRAEPEGAERAPSGRRAPRRGPAVTPRATAVRAVSRPTSEPRPSLRPSLRPLPTAAAGPTPASRWSRLRRRLSPVSVSAVIVVVCLLAVVIGNMQLAAGQLRLSQLQAQVVAIQTERGRRRGPPGLAHVPCRDRSRHPGTRAPPGERDPHDPGGVARASDWHLPPSPTPPAAR